MIDVHGQNILVKEGHDEHGNRYFRFSVQNSAVDTSAFSFKQIIDDPKPLFTELGNAGVNLLTSASRNKFLKELEVLPSASPIFKVATHLGWHGRSFVLPDVIVGKPKIPLVPGFRDLDPDMLAKYRFKGAVKDWQDQLGGLCVGNSRLMFAVCLAFTGPILRFVSGSKTGGFQLVGDAEQGKTTAAMVSGSVLGCHRSSHRQGFIESWHTTNGKVEITALAHNDGLLILDETKQAGQTDQLRAQAVIGMTFALAEGTEKQRLTNPLSARTWRLFFLSTSNYTVRELAQRGGLDVDDAILGRITDIPSPQGGFGIYQDLHGFADGAALTDELKVRCRKFYGAPFRDFVRLLVEDRKSSAIKVKKYIAARRAWYLKKCKAQAKAHELHPLNRATARFATVYAAGCLAIKYGVLGWNREAMGRAILSCQMDGLRLDTDHAKANVEPTAADHREKLVEYFRVRQPEFMNLDADRPKLGSHEFGAVPGYTATFKGEKWFYLTADRFREVAGSSEAAKELATLLVAEKLMAPPQRGLLVQRPIFLAGKGNKHCKWVHAFRTTIID